MSGVTQGWTIVAIAAGCIAFVLWCWHGIEQDLREISELVEENRALVKRDAALVALLAQAQVPEWPRCGPCKGSGVVEQGDELMTCARCAGSGVKA